MRWEKRGLIYNAPGTPGWKNQFAMLPTPIMLGEKLRIYLGFCDEKNVGRIGYVDVDPDDPSKIIAVSDKPVLDIGEKGCFDDNGVVPISICRKDNKIYLYYIGFQLGVNVPYYMFCGLAISEDGDHFIRHSKCPILDRKGNELFARCGVNVIFSQNRYKMYYVGSLGDGWTMSQGKLKPLYTMQYLESPDGVLWDGMPIQCINFQNEDEHGFGRPFVWFDPNRQRYRMLYSIRTYSRGYYIGYAESDDGKTWERRDAQAGISVSEQSSWDDSNLSYPYVFWHKNRTYLFYNGNGCGKSGFGYAELVED